MRRCRSTRLRSAGHLAVQCRRRYERLPATHFSQSIFLFQMLDRFDRDREKNRAIVEATGESNRQVDTALLEFDKHSQTPNDAYAIRIRLGILLRYLKKHFKIQYDKSVLQPPE